MIFVDQQGLTSSTELVFTNQLTRNFKVYLYVNVSRVSDLESPISQLVIEAIDEVLFLDSSRRKL